jgi:hypothetical protein
LKCSIGIIWIIDKIAKLSIYTRFKIYFKIEIRYKKLKLRERFEMMKTNEMQVANGVEQEFEVFADVKLPVSIKESLENATLQLNDYVIQQILLTLISNNEQVTISKVHDWTVENLTEIGEEDGFDDVQVFADMELVVSIKLNARDDEEAMKKAELLIGDYAVRQAMLTVVLASGKVVTLNVHDWVVNLGGVFGEDE